MDRKLLLDIFKIPARTRQEGLMRNFIKKFLTELHISYSVDKKGNLYNINNNNSPLLSAHMDTVQDVNDAKLAHFTNIHGNYISGYGVIGGDDKCGIYIILELLKERKDLNFVFSVEEESGGNGIMPFVANNDFSHIPYGIVLDRRGGNDIVCEKNDYGVKEFEDVLARIGKLFGYKPAIGTFSDADYLNEQLSVANLSVGYYNPHTKAEFVKINEMKNAMDFVWHLVKNVNTRFRVPTPTKSYKSGYRYEGYEYGDDYDDYETNFKCSVCGHASWENIYLSTTKKYICRNCFDGLYEELLQKNEDLIVAENSTLTEQKARDLNRIAL